jgi:hypothetical protein
MKKKLIIIVFCLLSIGSGYSQNVLIDKITGDTLVTISIEQMDNIYIELIQKDSLIAQAEISLSKEVKLYELISITKTNLNTSQEALKIAMSSNAYLREEDKTNREKIKRNRKIAIYGWSVALLSTFLGLITR